MYYNNELATLFWHSSLLRLFLCVFSFWGSPTSSHKLAKGGHLLLSATRSPLVNDPELSTVSLGVLEAILVDILSSHLDFTFEICPPNTLSPGFLLPNGSWTGSTGQLQRREVDMCVTTTALTSDKRHVVDISFPVIYVEAGIIIPFPREKSKWIDTSAFQDQTWVALGVSFGFMIFATWVVHRVTYSRKKDRSQNSLIYWIFYFVSIWTTQSITLRNPSTHFRLVCSVCFFGIFVISNYFTAAYTSVLSIPIFKTSISSVDDLANSDTVKTLLVKGSSTDEYIMTSTDDPTMHKISEQMKRYPERRILNAFNVDDISTIVKDDFALVMVKSNAESVVQASYRLNQECRVTLAEKTFFSRAQGFTFPKNSPLVSVIDYDLMLMHQMGLIQYAERRSFIQHNRCSVSEIKNVKTDKPLPLKLNEVIGAFFILGWGLGVSFFMFVNELVVSKLIRGKISRESRRLINNWQIQTDSEPTESSNNVKSPDRVNSPRSTHSDIEIP